MHHLRRFLPGLIASAALMAVLPSRAADDPDLGALDLKSAAVEPTEATAKPTRFFVEAALGSATQRYAPGSQSLRRLSLDLFHAQRLAPGWRGVISDRIDYLRPRDAGSDSTLNSLREAYVSWDGEGSHTVVDIGRINLRLGPGYGYNPTDFFRDGALRSVTSVNPFALRENRLGTVALRGQRLWQGGSAGITFSPKLANSPSGQSLNLDLGATNHRNRLLLTASQQLSDRVSAQVLLHKEPGLSAQPGASLTALLTDAMVAHAEWSYARAPSLADLAWARKGAKSSGHRLATGLTTTTATKLSFTAELQYNGLALARSAWDSTTNPALLGSYLLEAQRLQDLAARRAYLFYATQRDIGLKNLDLTAFVRANAQDHSRLAWLELRYHWASLDLGLQWQQYSGSAKSEFGLNPQRRVVQLLAAYRFQ